MEKTDANIINQLSATSQIYIEHFIKSFNFLDQLKEGKISATECDAKIRELNKGIIIPYKP